MGGFPNIKKDGTSHAGKLIQPVLKLLNDDSSEAIWVSRIVGTSKLINLFYDTTSVLKVCWRKSINIYYFTFFKLINVKIFT